MCRGCAEKAAKEHDQLGNLPFAAGDNANFDCDLTTLMTNKKQTIGHEIPDILAQCISFVEATGLTTEGIYRKSGSAADIEVRKEKYNRGRVNSVVRDAESDPHAIAGLLKLWLRTLPQPLLTFELFDEFVALAEMPTDDVAGITTKARELVDQLPDYNRFATHALLQHAQNVASFGDENMMKEDNIAIVFGPNILRRQASSPLDDLKDSPKVIRATEILIRHFDAVLGHVGEQRKAFRAQMAPVNAAAAMMAKGKGPLAGAGPGNRGSINF
jgi:hypothetical protein